MRSSVVVASLVSLALGVACNTAKDEQEKAAKAQAEASEKIAEANQEATKKVNEAQAEADEKTAEAQASFLKIREDYRHEVTTKLVDLDKKVADLAAKAKTATGQKKIDLEARLKEIHTEREAFVNEYRTIESASASTWDDTKRRLDKSWTQLKSLVDRA